MSDPPQSRRRSAQTNTNLSDRTKAFAIRVIRMYTQLPRTPESRVLGYQVLRSGTSVGANYREATRARSVAEFVSKLRVALQELEETDYWLELLVEGRVVDSSRLVELRGETRELVAMLVASINTASQKAKPRRRA